MAPAKSDLQSSIAGDSVFDWGFTEYNSKDSGGSGSVFSGAPLGGRAGSPREGEDSAASAAAAAPPSRYDPQAMSRIVDITDLVDDSEETDDDDGDFETVDGASFRPVHPLGVSQKQTKEARKLRHRRVAMLAAITAVVFGTAAAIAYVVLNPEERVEALRLRPIEMGEGRDRGARQQTLLETAERVAEACDVTNDAAGGDLGRCFELCEEKECCFDEEDSCEDDEEANCAAYAGCLALRAGTPLDAAEEDVERKDRR